MAVAPTAIVRRGRGAPLLCIHGSGVDHRLLLPLDQALDGDDLWERIYLDLPGFGSTPPLEPPGGLPALIDWVDNLVSTQLETRRFAILANSLGGLIARELVARRPAQVAALALLAPVVDPRAEHRKLPPREVLDSDVELLKTLSAGDAAAFSEMAVVHDAAHWERFRDAALPGIRAANQSALVRLEAAYALETPLPEQRFTRFDGPTIIIVGRQDHVVGFEDQVALSPHYPRASIAVLDRAGHNVHLDQPTVVYALIRAWQSEAAKACAARSPSARSRLNHEC